MRESSGTKTAHEYQVLSFSKTFTLFDFVKFSLLFCATDWGTSGLAAAGVQHEFAIIGGLRV